MGGDGGTTGNERKYMRGVYTEEGSKFDGGAAKSRHKELKQKSETRDAKIRTCAMIGDPLTDRIVIDRLGNLMNKAAVLNHLLEKRGSTFRHIHSLKDVIEPKFTKNPNHVEQKTDSKHYLVVSNSGQYMCPVTMDEFNGCHNFVIIWSTGAVISEKALKELKMTECPVTSQQFAPEDVIHLAPDEEKYKEMHATEEARYLKEKETKKAAKAAKKAAKAAVGEGDSQKAKEEKAARKELKRKRKEEREKFIVAPKEKKSSIHSSVGATKLAAAAVQTIKEEQKKNAVYGSLFKKFDKYENTQKMFMETAGFRGTIS